MQRNVLALFAFIICLSAVFAQQSFVVKDFFLGDWQLESQKTNLQDPAVVGLVETASWKVKDGNLTLFGTYIDEKDEERPLLIEFEGERAGRFSLSLPEEEDHVVIFEFQFENRSAGYFVSQGPWKDEHRGETGVYQLFVTSPASFILSITLKNAEGQFTEVNTITGRKFIEKEPPGFFQRFGMPLGLFVVLMISQYMKGRQQGQQPEQQEAAAPASGQRRRNNNDQSDEPKITEIKDEGEGSSEGKKDK